MRLRIAALIMIWGGVVATTFGAYMRQHSPRYERWQRQELQKVAEQTDGPLLAAAFGTHWRFEGFFDSLIACMFSVGLVTSCRFARRRVILSSIIRVCFCAGCLWGAALDIAAGLDCFRWGFVALGLGDLLAAAALCLGIVVTAASNTSSRVIVSQGILGAVRDHRG